MTGSSPTWTDDELEGLIAAHRAGKVKAYAASIGRGYSAAKIKLHFLRKCGRLEPNPRMLLTRAMMTKIAELWPTMGPKQISEIIGGNPSAIGSAASRMGLPPKKRGAQPKLVTDDELDDDAEVEMPLTDVFGEHYRRIVATSQPGWAVHRYAGEPDL